MSGFKEMEGRHRFQTVHTKLLTFVWTKPDREGEGFKKAEKNQTTFMGGNLIYFQLTKS